MAYKRRTDGVAAHKADDIRGYFFTGNFADGGVKLLRGKTVLCKRQAQAFKRFARQFFGARANNVQRGNFVNVVFNKILKGFKVIFWALLILPKPRSRIRNLSCLSEITLV